MQDLKKQVEELLDRFEKLKINLNLEEKKKTLDELVSTSEDPNLWNDPDNARKVMQSLSDLRQERDEVENLSSTLSTLQELVSNNELTDDFKKEIENLERMVSSLETKSYLSGLYDQKDAIVSIHAGQGGTEAMDWTQMLLRMYLRFCEKKDWPTEVIDSTPGEEAGLKSVTFKVNGLYAYGYLKKESGTHRLVRQSPFNADNLRQTSFALVEVLPELEESDLPDIDIKEEDLQWQFVRSGGHGGQNVNKVSTAVRLTHIPTQISVSAQTERFQEQNRKIALNLLRAKLWLRQKEIEKNEKKAIKGEYRPASWGNQIRSYVLHPYKMVKDLRTNCESKNPTSILDGELDEFIKEELRLK